MKIEIGESLMLSYFKHIKKCILYQTNWKVAIKNWGIDENLITDNYNKIIEQHGFSELFSSK